jgi:hypothetical protein
MRFDAILLPLNPNDPHDDDGVMQQTLGPFRAGLPVDVPLWFAIVLKKRNKCRIQYPLWLDTGILIQIIIVLDGYSLALLVLADLTHRRRRQRS